MIVFVYHQKEIIPERMDVVFKQPLFSRNVVAHIAGIVTTVTESVEHFYGTWHYLTKIANNSEIYHINRTRWLEVRGYTVFTIEDPIEVATDRIPNAMYHGYIVKQPGV